MKMKDELGEEMSYIFGAILGFVIYCFAPGVQESFFLFLCWMIPSAVIGVLCAVRAIRLPPIDPGPK